MVKLIFSFKNVLNIYMGCIQTGRRTIISVNPILGQLNKQENLTTMQSPTANKKRSTLKEITKLAFNSKNIKIKSCISLANSKPEDDYRIINKLGKTLNVSFFVSLFKP